MKKIHDQPMESQMIPPRIGPATGPTRVVMAQMTVARVAFSLGKTRSSSICDSGMIGPPKRPSSTRAPSSMPSEFERPHSSETTANAR
jgi:hypothetical protein